MICMNNCATPDPEKAEHINVPATGEVQALWAAERIISARRVTRQNMRPSPPTDTCGAAARSRKLPDARPSEK